MKKINRLCRGLILGLVIWFFPGMAEAAVPDPTDDFYVNDYAGVLSDSTKNDIIDKNIELEDAAGAQIVVVTTDSYGSQDGGAYTEDLFDDWGIGSAQENNGFLLVLFIEDDDYYALQGSGITNVLSDAVIDDILYDTLEPYFADQKYDEGVAAVFDEFYGVMADYYGTNTTGSGAGGNEPVAAADEVQSGGIFSTIMAIIIMFILIWFFFRLMSRLFRPRNYGGGYGGGGGTGGAFLGGFFLGRMRRPWGWGRRRRFGAPPPPPGGPGRGAPPPGGAGRMNTPPGGAGAGRRTGSGTSGGGLFGGGGGTSSGGGAGRNTSGGSSRGTGSGRTSSPTYGRSGSSRSTGSGRSSSPGFGGGRSGGGGGRRR